MRFPGSNRKRDLLSLLLPWCLALGIGCFWSAFAQTAPSGRGEKIGFNQYYPAPHNTQLKYQVSGAEGRTLSNGCFALKQLRIATFRTTGEREVSIEAPDCIYDDNRKEAASPGTLQIQYGNDQLRLGGEGFLWRQRNTTLIISNRVQAVIRRQSSTGNTSPLEITSRWFELDATNRHGVFHENVSGADASMEFSCGILGIRAGTNASSFDFIEARNSVTFTSKTNGWHLAAQRCDIARADDRAVLTGGVNWTQGRMSGRADRVTAYNFTQKTNLNIEAQGNVVMKLPREELKATGGFLSSANKAIGSDLDAPLLDVFADRFVSVSNQLLLAGSVRLNDGTNKLSCDRIEAVNADTPGETAVASGNVVLEQGTAQITSARAAYSKADDKVVFTGDPHWRNEQLEGWAQQVIASARAGEFFAQTNVTVRYTLNDSGASLQKLFPFGTNSSPDTPGTIEINSRTFNVRAEEREAVFAGNVRSRQIPQTEAAPRLSADSLTIRIAPGGGQVESLKARGNFVFEQGTSGVTNGPAAYRHVSANSFTAHVGLTGTLSELVAEGDVEITQAEGVARGQRVSYNAAEDRIELTGNPTFHSREGITSSAEKFIYDRAQDKWMQTGPFRVVVPPKTLQQGAESQKLPGHE